MVYIDYIQGTVKMYEDGCNFEDKDPFRASFHFLKLSPTILYGYNMLGSIKRKDHIEYEKKFKEQGIKYIIGYFPTKWLPNGYNQLLNLDIHIKEL